MPFINPKGESFATWEEYEEDMDRRWKEKPWTYRARVRIRGWWGHGWIDKVKPTSLYRRAKYFIQRGRRGWADCDTWSLDHYLARVIGESVYYFAEHSHGWNDNGRWKTADEYMQFHKDLAASFLMYADLDDQEMEDVHPEWREWCKLPRRKMHRTDLTYAYNNREEQRAIYEMGHARRLLLQEEMRELLADDVWPHLWD